MITYFPPLRLTRDVLLRIDRNAPYDHLSQTDGSQQPTANHTRMKLNIKYIFSVEKMKKKKKKKDGSCIPWG